MTNFGPSVCGCSLSVMDRPPGDSEFIVPHVSTMTNSPLKLRPKFIHSCVHGKANKSVSFKNTPKFVYAIIPKYLPTPSHHADGSCCKTCTENCDKTCDENSDALHNCLNNDPEEVVYLPPPVSDEVGDDPESYPKPPRRRSLIYSAIGNDLTGEHWRSIAKEAVRVIGEFRYDKQEERRRITEKVRLAEQKRQDKIQDEKAKLQKQKEDEKHVVDFENAQKFMKGFNKVLEERKNIQRQKDLKAQRKLLRQQKALKGHEEKGL